MVARCREKALRSRIVRKDTGIDDDPLRLSSKHFLFTGQQHASTQSQPLQIRIEA